MSETTLLRWPANGLSVAVRNARNDRVLATDARVAETRMARAVGLLRHRDLPPGEGLWITPCRGVHTFGMRFAIDIIALDPLGRVVDLVERMRPWRIRWPREGGIGVLELPRGTIALSGTRRDDRIIFEKVHRASSIPDGRAA